MKEFIELYDTLMVNLSEEEERELQKAPFVKYDERVWVPVIDWLTLKGLPVTYAWIDDSGVMSLIKLFIESWNSDYHDIMINLFGNYTIEAHERFDEDGPTGDLNLKINAVIQNN